MKQLSALIIFVRNPVLGKVKTRIAATAGAENALLIYKKLLEHTHVIASELKTDKYVFYADFINHEDLWEEELFYKELQGSRGAESDLGERMKSAFEYLFDKGYQKIGIIGSDCYELSSEILKNAFEMLENKDVVIGPAIDGGYYFLGMNRFLPEIFESKNWSSPTVYKETIKQITDAGNSYYSLPTLSDVDEEADVTFNYLK